MLKGIHGKPYVDLSNLIDHSSFTNLHADICRGFALGRDSAAIGSLDVPDGFMNLEVYNDSFTPLHQAYKTFLSLPETHPIKINGQGLNDADLATYLKFALKGYDLYSFYFLIDFKEGWRTLDPLHGITESAKYFPTVTDWIKSLVDLKVFSHIGRAAFFVQEAGGISFEHKDPSVDPAFPDILSEFIHIRLNLNRPFYVRDNDTKEKFYINSCIGYWNDQDWHGGDTVLEPSYSFRVDGVFTDEFRKKINV
jgi:Rieske 2Fe-2S family protein